MKRIMLQNLKPFRARQTLRQSLFNWFILVQLRSQGLALRTSS
jgi:hypothetical protein